MNREYVKPELELTLFDSADIITTSGVPMDAADVNPQEGYGDITDLGGGGDIGQPLQ